LGWGHEPVEVEARPVGEAAPVEVAAGEAGPAGPDAAAPDVGPTV
jgi:hypothetical protein